MRLGVLLPLVLVGLTACANVYRDQPSSYVSNRIEAGKRDLARGDREAALAHYEVAAATGDPFGQFKAAQLHSGGPEAERDRDRAIELLRAAIDERSVVQSEAKVLLARLIAEDQPAEALALMREAEAEGEELPPGIMARLLIEQGFEAEAEPWLELGRAQDDLVALQLSVERAVAAGQTERAERYARQLAFEYRRLVEVEDKLWAAWLLARLYDDGEALPRDLDRAIEWYTIAADAGSVRAMRRLTRGFLQGHDDFPVRPEAGRKWGEAAAAAGDVPAKAYLGRALLTGAPLEKDVARGVALLEEAAAEGHLAAMTDLGRAYLEGEDVIPNPERGLGLLQTAAARGSASALNALGWAYWNGELIAENRDLARRYMREAAALGHPSAQMFLDLYG